MNNEIPLSGHHLLILICAIGSKNPEKYYGILGNDFKKALEIIKTNPVISIKIAVGGDFICYPCPEHDKGKNECKIYPQNIGKDERVLEVLKIKENDEFQRNEIFKLIKEKINKEIFDYVFGKKKEEWINDYEKGLNILLSNK